MARIPKDELDRIKREVSLERLIESQGIELRRHGKDLLGLCPFHDDREPSLVVSPKKNLWHCLGACQMGGSVIDWVMKAQGVSFRHAVELMRADLPALDVAAPSGAPPKASSVRKLPPPVDTSAGDQELLRQVVGFYHDTLKQSPEALGYLESRGLVSHEMIERFRLGFANRTLGYRLPAKNRKAGEAIRGRLTELGVYRQSGHEHFNGSVVIPVLGEGGQVLEMYGRKITARLKKGLPLHLYLPGPHRGVWNQEAVAHSKEIILCESLIDALTFWCAGFRHVTASYGTQGFTQDHLEAFKQHQTERVLIAYDRDEAGDKAAAKLSETLSAHGIASYRVLFPRGMDANEYARKLTPAAQSLGLVLRKAEWMSGGAAPAKPAPQVPAIETEWDQWQARALAAGVSTELAALGRQVMREAEQHQWSERARSLAGWDDEGAAMLRLALAAPESADRVWQHLLDTDGQLPDDDDVADENELGDDHDCDDEPSPASLTPPTAPAEAQLFPLAASPEPPLPKAPRIEPEQCLGDEVIFVQGDRRYRVRGLAKNQSLDQLRVNVLCSRGEAFFVDSLDLYSSKHRQTYVQQAAGELGVTEDVIKKDLGRVLLSLEELCEKRLAEKDAPKSQPVMLSEADKQAALELLRDPLLLERIAADFDKSGVVGEHDNKLVGYLGAVSRKLDQPLAIVIQSSSAAGKSSLMDAILSFVPPEDRVQYSAMTGQSLFYMGETDLAHKILAIVEEQGAERASYALKLLQSEGELTIASTGKDPATGRLITQEYRVEGPVMIFLTTTAIEIDEELLNRCLVLSVSEDRQQTRAIHDQQRRAQTLEGLLEKKDREHIWKVHRDAQRLLRPLLVANPFADKLTFIDEKTRTRRDHMKYLTLIRTIALLHQYQREHKSVTYGGERLSYIEVTQDDISVANHLAHRVLGRSLDDLPPQTRRLLMLLDEMVTAACERLAMDRTDYRFTRREVREALGWGNTQLKIHLGRLEEMEYVTAHRGGRHGRYVYELCYDGGGKDGQPFLVGLADAKALGGYDANRSGPKSDRSVAGRGSVGAESGPGRSAETRFTTAKEQPNGANGRVRAAQALLAGAEIA